MNFLLDTDICSAHFRRPGGLAHRFLQYSGRLSISTVTLAELYSGAYHLLNPNPLVQKIADLLIDVTVIEFDSQIALQFGIVRGGLLKQGITVPTADLMIGVTALSRGMTLVTHNTADYTSIPGLELADWLVP